LREEARRRSKVVKNKNPRRLEEEIGERPTLKRLALLIVEIRGSFYSHMSYMNK